MEKRKLILKNEKGVALLTCLMLLVIVLLIGMAATDTTIVERQIAANEAAYRRGFYKADAGISYARTVPETDIPAQGELIPVPTGAPFKLTTFTPITFSSFNEKRYEVMSESIPSDYDAKVILVAEIQIPSAGRRPDLPGHQATY